MMNLNHMGRSILAVEVYVGHFKVVIRGSDFLDILLDPNLSFAFAMLC